MTRRPRGPEAGAWLEGARARFRVWAPEHERLEVVSYDEDGRSERGSSPARKGEGGFFEAEVPARGRVLYKLRVDGAGPFPDPLSSSQPFGVHGPSEVIAHDHPWTDGGWRGVALEDLVVYELHVGTATADGTFDALIPRLDAIRRLGATAIELLPIASFPGARNWGYDGVSLRAPAAVYGGPEGLRRLVDAAHARGLAVLVDAVYNHLGPDGNYLRCYSRGYFTDRHTTPWGDAIDYGADPVRELVIGSAEVWIRDYHADGLRLDATHAIADDRDPHVLRALAERCRAAAPGRRVLVIAEDDRNDARLLLPASRGGLGLDAVWADDLHHVLRRAFAGDAEGYYEDYAGSAAEIAGTLRRGWLYEGQPSKHRGGAPRGTPAAGLEPPSFVHCIQNHDQVGNRALGDRLIESVSAEAYRAMTAILLLSPYTPLLFMGQEWGARTPFQYFTDHHPELGRLVTEGRRAEFKAWTAFAAEAVPDPQAVETFERSRLDWSERERRPHAEMLAWYEELLRLRASHPCLRRADRDHFAVEALGDEGLLLERRAGGRSLLVILGVRGRVTRDLPGARLLLSSSDPRFGGEGAAARLDGELAVLDGPAALVVERDPRAL